MTGSTERDFELAEMRAGQERDASIKRAQEALAGDGSDICDDCGEEIDALRRRLIPSARRCTHCQTRVELGGPR